MKSKRRRKWLRWLLIPLITLIVLIVIAAGILYSQQQRLVKMAISEVNKKLSGQVSIEGSDISVYENFPYISIRLLGVKFYDSKLPGTRPLFEAEKVFAGFSLEDILRKKYRVKVIGMKNGHLDLVQDKQGHINIVEASRIITDTTAAKDSSTAALDLDIKKIVFKGMDISFVDRQSGQRIGTHIDKIISSLQTDSARINADLHGALVLDYTRPGDTTLFRHKHLRADLQLAYEKPTEIIRLPLGKLKLEDASFNISGSADLRHNNSLDIKFSGDKPDFRQLFAFAPPEVAKELKHFKYDGHLAFEGFVKGAPDNPQIALSFSCANAWLHNTESNKKLDSLAFKGYYTNGAGRSLQTSELSLLNINARPGSGLFRGNFVMRDFTNPKVLMQVNSDLELGFIGAFLGIKDLQRITGRIILNMNFRELVDISVPEHSMGKLTQGIQSELTVRDLTFRIPNYPYNVENLDLHADM
ncbi:MAG: AsmA family protein, partial [Bacteroidetes bacterium]|nr:AsmA family protein [Bacteroidota bacterium]